MDERTDQPQDQTASARASEHVPNTANGLPTLAFDQTEGGVQLRDSSEHAGSDHASCRYQILGEIDRGGMGAVLKGRDSNLGGRDVAVKVLLEQHVNQPELRQRFEEEAQITGQLQHPGIVPVYDLGHLDNRPFFSMKLVKGDTLSQRLHNRTNTQQTLDKFLGIFQQIAQAVAYAHARGVIHRDLKPSNIMLGGFGEVLVMDWGLAKVLPNDSSPPQSVPNHRSEGTVIHTARGGSGSDQSTGTETQAGSMLGTPAYMAPEQARGDVDLIDKRADVFGLGAILCEILTGHPPYTGTGAEVKRKARTASLDEARERLANCGADRELIELTQKCLSAEPWQRPVDASAVVAAITGYLDSVAQRLHQAELSQAAEEARRIEAQATAEQERKARESAEKQVSAERHARRLTLSLVTILVLVVALGGGVWAWMRHEFEKTRALDARRQALETKREALEDLSIGDSRSTQTLMLALVQQEDVPAARHIVKKIQMVQTLGRVAFADSSKAREAALESWRVLEEYLVTYEANVWFLLFLAEHESDLTKITREDSSIPKKREGLLAISRDLRDAIHHSNERRFLKPLLVMLPHWYAQAGKAAEKLAAVAAEGKPLEEVSHYANQFWKLYCCELVLIEQQGVEKAMVRFGESLDEWSKQEDGKAPTPLRDTIQKASADLQSAFQQELKQRMPSNPQK